MNDKLKMWMTEKESRLSTEEKRKRDKLLIDQGLFDKVYGSDPNEFYRFEVDEQGNERRYKEVPIQITDEEYRQIRSLLTKTRLFIWDPVLLLRIASGMVFAGCLIEALRESDPIWLLLSPGPAALLLALTEIADRLKK